MKQTNYFSVKELIPGVYGFSNCAVASFLIVGKERALLFDTGYGVADLKQAVEEITKLPLYVVNSHGHFDHTVGNSVFPGPYYMHKADLEVYHRHNSPESRRMGLEAVQKFQRILFFLHWIPKNLDVNAYLNGMPEDSFLFVEEGCTFDLGGVTAEVVEIPGHTPGSIGLLVRKKRLFLASDIIFRRQNPTVAEYCEKWLYMKSANISAATLRGYTNAINNYIVKPLGDMYMSDVTADDIRIALVPVRIRAGIQSIPQL